MSTRNCFGCFQYYPAVERHRCVFCTSNKLCAHCIVCSGCVQNAKYWAVLVLYLFLRYFDYVFPFD
jgi:hypothetical protein